VPAPVAAADERRAGAAEDLAGPSDARANASAASLAAEATSAPRGADAFEGGFEARSWQARVDAIARWSAAGQANVARLHAALRDESAEVAAAAALALGKRAGAEAIGALTEVLENRDGYFSPVTRAAAVQALADALPDGELGLVRTALTDVDAEVSLAAIAALASRAPSSAAGDLLSLLQDLSGYFLPPVRLAAAGALAQLGMSPQQRAQLLAQERDPAVQAVFAGA
jgi:HEAT repeat protein